ncbi:hypothetical protein OG225_43160 (plasmid) [Nocardia sp. NBC_01377]|uniref:hypothetical protein n=1 Tax=Nocardia sp. NBC_01377 TaxID=2903595 RepID=UPI002F9134FA
MTFAYIRFTLPNGDYAQWRHHGDDMPALVAWYTAEGVRLDVVNETSVEAIARLTNAHPGGRIDHLSAEQPHAAHVPAPAAPAPPIAAPFATIDLIARRAPVGHPQHRGPRVQVYRVDSHGHGIEVAQYIEQFDHATTTAENALTAAGYTLAGVWRPEAEPGTVERLPLRSTARGFLLRMQRAYAPPRSEHAADPAAAETVRAVLARVLLSVAGHDDPAVIGRVLTDEVHAAHVHARIPARTERDDPQASGRAAEILARIIGALDTEFAPR